MKLTTINILKKNRKYFAARLPSGVKCKLIIDANSENLETGEHTLTLDDKSVRTKYGTDVIFAMESSKDDQDKAGICTLRAPYNTVLVDKCRSLGGRWDGDSEAWIFSGLIADEVESLESHYSDDMTAVELTALDGLSQWHGPVTAAGCVIATAWGRDSGAKLGHGVSQLDGYVSSGGSVKNWTSRVGDESVFRLYMPKAIIDEIDTDEWDVKIIDEIEESTVA